MTPPTCVLKPICVIAVIFSRLYKIQMINYVKNWLIIGQGLLLTKIVFLSLWITPFLFIFLEDGINCFLHDGVYLQVFLSYLRPFGVLLWPLVQYIFTKITQDFTILKGLSGTMEHTPFLSVQHTTCLVWIITLELTITACLGFLWQGGSSPISLMFSEQSICPCWFLRTFINRIFIYCLWFLHFF